MSPLRSLMLLVVSTFTFSAGAHHFYIPRFECCTSYDDHVNIVQVCLKGMNKERLSNKTREECREKSRGMIGLSNTSCMTPMCKEVGWSWR